MSSCWMAKGEEKRSCECRMREGRLEGERGTCSRVLLLGALGISFSNFWNSLYEEKEGRRERRRGTCRGYNWRSVTTRALGISFSNSRNSLYELKSGEDRGAEKRD